MEENQYKTPISAEDPVADQFISKNQHLFLRYFTGFLIDLVVLNLFEEHLEYVVIESFTISLIVAFLLQVMLKFTIAVEHWYADFCNARSGAMFKFIRYFGTWAILFISKILILGIVTFAFGDKVYFGGPMHGALVFIAVIVTMLVAEEIILRIYRWIGRETAPYY